jgi:dihydroxyacetone synthase
MAPSAIAADTVHDVSKVSSVTHLGQREEHDLVLRTFRVLIADLVQQYNGGHPG